MAFNDNKHCEDFVKYLAHTFKLNLAIETGTYKGVTTKALAAIFDRVYTIESNESLYRNNDFKAYPQIKAILGNSGTKVADLIRKHVKASDRLFVYLDAHWGRYLPLRDEILALRLPCLLAIDDFQIPGRPDLPYDKPINLAYVLPALRRLYGADLHYMFYIPPVPRSRGRLFAWPKSWGTQHFPRPLSLLNLKQIEPKHPPAPLERHSFYSPDYNLRLYHITKCGLTSLRRELKLQVGETNRLLSSTKTLCVVREPIERFVSGFLTLRKIGLMDMYQVRRPGEHTARIIRTKPLLEAFEHVICRVLVWGPFDSHIQHQVEYLGPSNTIQNKFCGHRKMSDIDYLIPLPRLNGFMQRTFKLKVRHVNKAMSRREVKQCHDWLNRHPHIKRHLLQVYSKDVELYQQALGSAIIKV